jgi:DNA-binding GntR family transcriptional regulator
VLLNYYRHVRELQEHSDSALHAMRRGDAQAARALLRAVMRSAELALREVPDEGERSEG